MKKYIISTLFILFAVILSACSFTEQEEAFTPDTVHLTQILNSTFPSVSITDPETVTHLWGLYQGIEFDGTKDKLEKENAWSLAITFADTKSDKYELITIFAGGLCWLGEDYETLHVIKDGSSIYDKFLTCFEDFSEMQSYFDAKILEFHEEHILVECLEETSGVVSPGETAEVFTHGISTETLEELAVGDTIRIMFSATEDTIPIHIGNVSAILLLEQSTLEPISEPAILSVSDLNDIFNMLDLSNASLTYHNDTEETYSASAAIRAESYIEKLKSFTWKEYAPTSELNENDAYFYQLTAPNVTITTFLGRYDSNHPLHLITDDGEGWFVLPFIQNEENESTVQVSSMIYDIFSSWYAETETASLYSGTGTPLTAEEMDYFQKYTEASRTEYVEEWGGDITYATEISCFFTSRYDDVRELNFEEFMRYFPGDADNPAHTTDLEFEALKRVEGWPFTEVENLDKMPVPIHKYPRSRVDAVLTKYAGITTAELDTTGVAYLEEYDAFYNYTSDFGPGTFIPRYGEKNGDIVTIWEAPAGYDGSVSMLTLQNNGENWHILSHQAVKN